MRLFNQAPVWVYGLLTLAAAILMLALAGIVPVYAVETTAPVINEFVFNHVGTNTNEYVEILGAPNTDYSAYTLLAIEGDNSPAGTIDVTIAVGATDANGFWTTGFRTNTFESGTVSLLLVEGFTGKLGVDLDVNNDGVVDNPPWTRLVDGVAVSDSGVVDRTYAVPVLTGNYDGLLAMVGGASRIPDGLDTDSPGDWVRNDFDLAGIPGFTGTLTPREALNTPGAANARVPAPPAEACGSSFTSIPAIQGSGPASQLVGQDLATEGVVTGDFQPGDGDPFNSDLGGFYIQSAAGDGDPATSDGLFVYGPASANVKVGDGVRVRGTAAEIDGLTSLNVATLWPCSAGNTILPTPLTLADVAADFERYEGMLVSFPQRLTIAEYFNFDRFGEIVLAPERQLQPTALYAPGSAEALQLAAANALYRITLDDGRSAQNPAPVRHPDGQPFTLDHRFRGGDELRHVTGILDYRFGIYRVQPTVGSAYLAQNPRPAQPADVGGPVRVASLNVLNYFLSIDTGASICGPQQNQECRGADSTEEFTRQRTKLLSALRGLSADVVGLIELENTPGVEPLADLVVGLNEVLGAGTYAYVDTGVVGGDAIRVGLIYKPGTVSPVGAHKALTVAVDPRFLDDKNRPALAQTFAEKSTGGRFTVVVNHLKSKGSDCNDVGDPDTGDGQGNCNLTRERAAQALVDWLVTDPTGSGDPDFLIVGDLNAYDKEDPIDAIRLGADDTPDTADDYADLLYQFQGEQAYSYLFDGQLGYLDHALANRSLARRVTGAAVWHINADEPDILSYDLSFKPPAQAGLYAADAYRAADHDPLVLGLCADDIAPQVTVTATPNNLWPPNHQLVNVAVALNVTDASPYTVAFVSATSNQPDNGTGDGDTTGDIVIVDAYHFRLRAERSGGAARVYTLAYRVTDRCGNATDAAATVTVPANQAKPKARAAGDYGDNPALLFLPSLGN